MREGCYLSGSCEICGCDTPALQMANKACDGKEYPPMLSKKRWKLYIEGEIFILDREGVIKWSYNPENKTTYIYEYSTKGYKYKESRVQIN